MAYVQQWTVAGWWWWWVYLEVAEEVSDLRVDVGCSLPAQDCSHARRGAVVDAREQHCVQPVQVPSEVPPASLAGEPAIHWNTNARRLDRVNKRRKKWRPSSSNCISFKRHSVHSTSDYTFWNLHRSYFKGIGANIELKVCSLMYCWP
jgi:hypothetical protein